MSVVSIYCTFAGVEEAERVGRQVVEEQLAACINILAPCRSIYRWQGKVEVTDETPAILKTTAAAADSLIARIAELHSYEVPAITQWPVDQAARGFSEWVESGVRSLR
ncbi:divalent-cation tolerance protein CutA [Sphingomonas sinipercae]|uniref:Divalent-cation tolerance protein CutA n=1 Tax=Sphingomonas sinipercae TaxID=2714944 RepID=A0A6G7ZNW6_9SPHN|nr:divalent-cation tolerance protein CutA [Sphingomonas sinipercae]QIL02618.1 divalent-cation tolerance protein CutA [Sphingomonas sinipercae]